MNIKTTLTIWTVAFILTIATMEQLGWLFWISAGVFTLTCMYITHEQRRFENDLEDMFGPDKDFE